MFVAEISNYFSNNVICTASEKPHCKFQLTQWTDLDSSNLLGKVDTEARAWNIFGFDLLLVEPDYRPVLLEVNSSPSLRIDCMRPLVQPSSCKHGLNPAIMHSSKYAAFSRSRVDEQVKTGLLRATLSLIGSRLLFERMSMDSPEKAYAFLNACGYQTPAIPMEPKTAETPVEALEIAKKPPSREELRNFYEPASSSYLDFETANGTTQMRLGFVTTTTGITTTSTNTATTITTSTNTTTTITTSTVGKKYENASDTNMHTPCLLNTESPVPPPNRDNRVKQPTPFAPTFWDCSQSLPRLTQKNSPPELRTVRRHNPDFPSQWMHDRLSQIYDIGRKPRSPKVPSLEVNLEEIVPRSPPCWPPLRKRTLSAVYGRQHVNEKLTASFLDRRRVANCRDSRNLLHCIYSEDNVYFPCPPEGEHTRDTECEIISCRTLSSLENTSLNPGSLAQTFPSFEASKNTDICETAAGGDIVKNEEASSPDNMTSLQVEQTMPSQDQTETKTEHAEVGGIAEPNENQSNAQSYGSLTAEPKTSLTARKRRLPKAATVTDLRLLDKLADIFITILSERRLVEQQIVSGIDHCSAANFPYVIHLDSSGRTLSGHHIHRLDCSLGVEVLTPRMDSSGFRSFVQRCHLRNFGMNIHDLELMYMKHKIFWFRVYESDCVEAESGESLK
ncbi:unnamed protein product [Dibothriocephalus latus]|uniref:Uncharacterized protein n=1 Tax=Dibothriocephalus latus TaxID=60516 RepID=A0A3P6UFU1_DIBLA|nr:unnamed protein product [Dibothriocephalus latus]